jgi:hypothetical protein
MVGTDRKLPEPAPLAVSPSVVAPDTAHGNGVHILLARVLTDPLQAKRASVTSISRAS